MCRGLGRKRDVPDDRGDSMETSVRKSSSRTSRESSDSKSGSRMDPVALRTGLEGMASPPLDVSSSLLLSKSRENALLKERGGKGGLGVDSH